MIDSVREFLQGWRNHLIPPKHLKSLIDEVSNYRLQLCKPCEYNSTSGEVTPTSYCKKCSCPLVPKSKSFISKCPMDKWDRLMEQEEYKQFLISNTPSDDNEGTENKEGDS